MMTQTPYIEVSTTNPNTTPINPIVAPPSVTGTNTEPFSLQYGATLAITAINEGTTTTNSVTWSLGGSSAESYSAEQVVVELNKHLSGCNAEVDTGAVVISALSGTSTSSINVTGGTMATTLGLAAGAVAGQDQVAFKFDLKDTRQAMMAIIDESDDPETAIDVTITFFGYAEDGMWHAFERIVVDETGLCDCYITCPMQYSYIYLQQTAGTSTVKASLMNSITRNPSGR